MANILYYEDIQLVDGVKGFFGTSEDLQIYHDGSNSFIQDLGTGGLYVRSSAYRCQSTTGENMIYAVPDSGVYIYHNNVKKFETTSTGVTVTGGLTTSASSSIAGINMTADIAMGDYDITGIDELVWTSGTKLGDGGNTQYLRLTYAGTAGGGMVVKDGDNSTQGYLYADGQATSSFGLLHGGGSWAVRCVEDEYVELRYNNSTKFQTSNTGVTVTGTVSATGGTFSNAIGTFPLTTSTPYDYVAKFESTDAGAYIIIEDSSSTNNANRVGVAGNTMYLTTNATTALTLDGSQNATFAGDVQAPGIYVGSTNTSYDFYNNGTTYLNGAVTVDDNLTVTGNIYMTGSAHIGAADNLYVGGATPGTDHTYIGDSGRNVTIYNGATFTVASGTTSLGSSLTVSGAVTITEQIYHSGDSNTYFGFHNNDEFRIVTGGTERLEASNSGIKLGGSGSTVTTILDEDNMSSDSATALATQQSIKAYVDNSTTGVLTYQGTWNASTNSPTLSSGSGTPGYYYIVSVAGSTNLDGITDWAVGDWAVFSDQATDAWQKIDNTAVGNVSGSGANNRLTLWSGTSTVDSDSSFYMSGTTLYAPNLNLYGTLTSTSALTLDAAGQLNLDSGNSEIHLKGSGTTFGKLFVSGSDFYINNPTQDEDIVFSGNDGGSSVTALRLDMSDNGWAHFNAGVAVGAGTSTFAGALDVNGAVSSFGPAGTGTDDAVVSIDGGSGTGGEAYLRLTRGGTSGFILNHAASSLQVRATANIPMYFYTNDTLALTLDTSQNATFASSVSYAGTLTSTGSTTVPIYARSTGTVSYIQIQNSSTGSSGTGDGMTIGCNGTAGYLWLREQATLNIGTNDTSAITIDSAQKATFAGRVDVDGGDVNIKAGALSITSDGTNKAIFAESGAGLLTIETQDDIVLDAASDIILDAAGDDIRLRVNGTEFGKFNNASSNLNIYSSIQDKDIVFWGNDAGSSITALTLDMSSGGTATFNNELYIPNYICHVGDADTKIGFNTNDNVEIRVGGNLQISADASRSYLRYQGSSKIRTDSAGVDVTGGITATGQITTAASAVSAPGYSFPSDTNTGMYSNVTGYLMFAADGTQVMQMTDTVLEMKVPIQLDTSVSAGASSGTIIKIGSHMSALVAGNIYYAGNSMGNLYWYGADADSSSTENMLALSVGTDADVDGMLLNGIYHKASHGLTVGEPIYLSTTSMAMTNTAPSGANDYVRVLGYALDSNHIYFCPDNTWVKISS